MTKYFFDVRNSAGLQRDEDGIEFATLHEAQVEATRALADEAREVPISSKKPPKVSIEVRTGDDGPLFEVAMIIRSNAVD